MSAEARAGGPHLRCGKSEAPVVLTTSVELFITGKTASELFAEEGYVVLCVPGAEQADNQVRTCQLHEPKRCYGSHGL